MAFTSLKGEVKRKERPKAVRDPWISKETWRLEDQRSELLQIGRLRTKGFCKERREFQCALQEDSLQIMHATGSTTEGLIVDDSFKEAWYPLVRWYIHIRIK